MEFHETRMGQKFFEGDIPKLIHTLERVAKALETDQVMDNVTGQIIWKREGDDEEIKYDSTLSEKPFVNVDVPVVQPNTDLLCAARKAAGHWQDCEGYEQASAIITMLVDEVEKMYKLVHIL